GRRVVRRHQRRLVSRGRPERGSRFVTDRPASDVAGKRRGRWYIGLLLVAAPVLLVFWLIIFPIVSAVMRTVWLPDDTGVPGFTLETYAFFFTDRYSLDNLTLTLWT